MIYLKMVDYFVLPIWRNLGNYEELLYNNGG